MSDQASALHHQDLKMRSGTPSINTERDTRPLAFEARS